MLAIDQCMFLIGANKIISVIAFWVNFPLKLSFDFCNNDEILVCFCRLILSINFKLLVISAFKTYQLSQFDLFMFRASEMP